MGIAIGVSFFTGLMAYMLVYFGLEAGTRVFMARLVLGMVIKMLIGVIIVLVVVIEFKPVVKEYVGAYFIAYFAFTAFEVYGLMRKLRA